jgi:regulator of sigma E protease
MLVTEVVATSPANKAGIQSGDVIAKMSTTYDTFTPTTVADTIAYIQSHGTDPLTLSIVHKNSAHDVVVTPKDGVVGNKPGIGVGLADVSTVRLPFFAAVKEGFVYTGQQFVETLRGLGGLVSGIFHGQKGALSQVSGPVGIVGIAGQAYALGIGSFLSFVALISINLAVINLLPLPALDGGRLILEFFTVEGRSRIPKRVVNGINQTGFLLLILLMLYVTYHDIVRLIT